MNIKRNIIIRPITRHETVEMADIKIDSWQDDYRNIVPDKVLIDLEREETAKSLEDWLFADCDDIRLGYGGFLDNRLVGYITASLTEEVDADYDGEVNNLFVAKKYRGQGLGLRLLLRAALEFKENQFTSLILYSWRATASNDYYRKLGGRVVKEEIQVCGGENLTADIFAWQLEELIALLENKLQKYSNQL